MSPGKCLQIPGQRRSPHSEKGDQEQMLMLFCEFGSLFSELLVEPSENGLAETASLGDISVLLRKSEQLYFVYSSVTFSLCFLLFQPNWRINSLSGPTDIHRMEERKINEKENKRERKNCTPTGEISVESLMTCLCWCIQTDWMSLSWAAPDLKCNLVQRSAGFQGRSLLGSGGHPVTVGHS